MNILCPQKLSEKCTLLHSLYGDEKPFLEYHTPFAFLVSVILSAQSTDAQVNRIMAEKKHCFDTPYVTQALGLEAVTEAVKNIGLYRQKARNIMATAEKIIEKFGGNVPDNKADLLTLPGVGIKTAHVVLHTLFQQPYIAVDRHVFRVCGRWGIEARNPDALAIILEKKVPKEWKRAFSYLVIEHGRHTCQARKPQCHRCALALVCAQSLFHPI